MTAEVTQKGNAAEVVSPCPNYPVGHLSERSERIPCLQGIKCKTLTTSGLNDMIHAQLKGVKLMASVKWEGGKYHGAGETKAHFRHDEKEQRLAHEHANEHINKELTPFNYSMNGLSYAQMCEKYDKRVAELAPNTRMTKVTVTCQSLEIPAPAGLPKYRQSAWFKRVHELIIDFAGEENVIEGTVHVDELHEYIDASTGQKCMSRAHLHEAVVPAVDGKLNGREFSARKNIKRLNNIIHEMSVKEFGIPFHTGKGGKSTKSVEELKNESATLEAVQQIVSSEYADLCADLDEARYFAELELQEQIAQEAHDAYEQIEAKRKKEEADLKANIGPRIRKVYEREQKADAREALLLSLPLVHPDEDFLREGYMKTIKFKDGTTAEDRYQRYIAVENRHRQEAKRKVDPHAKDKALATAEYAESERPSVSRGNDFDF